MPDVTAGDIRWNTASAATVFAHLSACDQDFVPPLSERLDVMQYAEKIVARAETYEFWDGSLLVALVAAYRRDRGAYITSVSALPAFRGRGLTRALLCACIADVESASGASTIELEVAPSNVPAVDLYESLGFQRQRSAADVMTMRREGGGIPSTPANPRGRRDD